MLVALLGSFGRVRANSYALSTNSFKTGRWMFDSTQILPPLFYVKSPDYTHLSGGPIALHSLCHYLNLAGYEAYITAPGVSGRLRTPVLTNAIREAHIRAGRNAIAIYPEVQIGNPLQTKHVIRYLLNKPGARSSHTPEQISAFWEAPGRQSEFVLHYADEFQVPYLRSHPLWVPILDQNRYNKSRSVGERSGFLVYSHRVKFADSVIPEWVKPFTRLNMSERRGPDELAELYSRSEALITFERTGAIYEALMCDCPVVCVPNARYKDFPLFKMFGTVGIGWGTGPDRLKWSRDTLPVFQQIYATYLADVERRVRKVANDALSFFAY